MGSPSEPSGLTYCWKSEPKHSLGMLSPTLREKHALELQRSFSSQLVGYSSNGFCLPIRVLLLIGSMPKIAFPLPKSRYMNLRHFRSIRTSAICSAFSAAPFHNWSPTTHSAKPFFKAWSTRIRPTPQASFSV